MDDHEWLARAARHVDPGTTIFLDASPTALALATHLCTHPPRGVAVVTNSAAIANHVSSQSLRVFVCPGSVNQRTRAIEGPDTVKFLERQRVDTAFVSGSGSIAMAVRAIAHRTIDLASRECSSSSAIETRLAVPTMPGPSSTRPTPRRLVATPQTAPIDRAALRGSSDPCGSLAASSRGR